MAANPKCAHCNHPQSFHRNGDDGCRCQVGSCECRDFAPVAETAPRPAPQPVP